MLAEGERFGYFPKVFGREGVDGSLLTLATPFRVVEAADPHAHQLPSRRESCISIRRAMASTTKVTMKRTKPSSSSAER